MLRISVSCRQSQKFLFSSHLNRHSVRYGTWSVHHAFIATVAAFRIAQLQSNCEILCVTQSCNGLRAYKTMWCDGFFVATSYLEAISGELPITGCNAEKVIPYGRPVCTLRYKKNQEIKLKKRYCKCYLTEMSSLSLKTGFVVASL